jgi:iron complex transport system substrate-binding protein
MPQRRRAGRPRIVSTVPAATEIVAALGAADLLVGVSHECTLGEGLEPRPRVTASSLGVQAGPAEIHARVGAQSSAGAALFTLDGTVIERLEPDVIITQGLCAVCAVDERDVRTLASRIAPSPRVVALSASTLEGVFNDVAAVASALGLATDGDRLLASLRARMKRVHGVLSASRAPRPRVAVLEWTDPPFAAGHWVPEMVHRAGGADVLAVAGQHSREITWDALTDASPAIILVAPCGYDIAPVSSRNRWADAPSR